MSRELQCRLYGELDALRLIDPHTHINPHAPASRTLADILGYHYYTELAHSSGLEKEQIEEPGISDRDKVETLIRHLGPIDNTAQYSWLLEMAQTLFGFDQPGIDSSNWGLLFDQAQRCFDAPDWETNVLDKSGLDAVFLTNDFDDPLTGFDTQRYVPCLRTDDLVFHLGKQSVRDRLAASSGVTVADANTLRQAIGSLFAHFTRQGARACAISLPPDFTPDSVSSSLAERAVQQVYAHGEDTDASTLRGVSNFVFWTLAEFCHEHQLPFDLMIGVNRQVYPQGVFQGQDLYDSRVSLIQYQKLFNAFPKVTFPISVLASVTNQELTSYAWIFPNVVTHGHWWYSNTPSFIERDLAARLEAVPRSKQIGYYSDMYKLEFALPKFNMYKRILAKLLAERFVLDRAWSEEQALQLGRQILCENVTTTFFQ